MRQGPFANAVFFGAVGLVGFSLLAVGVGRYADVGTLRTPHEGPAVLRHLHFEDRPDGSVAVFEGDRLIERLEPGTGGFVRGVMRGLARERRIRDIDDATPFRLMRFADGRLLLEDPETGHLVALGAFGATNEAAFARLMEESAIQ